MHVARDRVLIPAGARVAKRPERASGSGLLILQPDHLGDIVLSTPAVRYLRQQLPDMRLTAAVGPWSKKIAQLAWPVDEVVTVNYPGFTRQDSSSPIAPYRQLSQEAERLQQNKAQHAVVLRPDAWWAAWLARMSVSDQVIGAQIPEVEPFLTLNVPVDHILPAAARSLEIARTTVSVIGRSLESQNNLLSYIRDMSPVVDPDQLPITPTDAIDRFDLPDDYLVIHPGSGADIKLWTASGWRKVIAKLDHEHVVVTGGPGEGASAQAIGAGFDHVTSIAGETSLDELAGVLASAKLVVGPDSGPLHLAAALGRPTVHLFGPSNSAKYCPVSPPEKHRIIDAGWHCPRCEDLSPERPAGCGCMLAITPQAVLDGISSLIESSRAGAPRN